jgi:hypothetical protein
MHEESSTARASLLLYSTYPRSSLEQVGLHVDKKLQLLISLLLQQQYCSHTPCTSCISLETIHTDSSVCQEAAVHWATHPAAEALSGNMSHLLASVSTCSQNIYPALSLMPQKSYLIRVLKQNGSPASSP